MIGLSTRKLSRTSGTSGPSTSSWNRAAATGGPDREVHAGDTLKERFKLEKEVGRGGMGIVFKAIDERKVEAQDKNPWVAVKVLNPEFRKHPQALVALQRESRKAQQLTHDNILRVYDFDKDGTVIYMTMEYCDAGALKDWIKKHPNGMGWEPHTGQLWTVVNERDELGRDLVPDYSTSVKEGGFCGWPFSYWGHHVDDRVQPQDPERVQNAIVPDYALGNHVAPLGTTFA